MLIHAFRRKAATPVDTGNTVIEFKPNEAGDVVADVAGEADAALLLKIVEAFRPYFPAVAALVSPTFTGTLVAPDLPAEPAAGKDFVLQNGDETLDLAALSDDELKAFAKENGVKVHWRLTGDKIRQVLVDALVGPADGGGQPETGGADMAGEGA